MSKPVLITYGEQGIGDELMFGSVLYDAKKDFDIILECHPRLEWLHNRAHPDIRTFPTRKLDHISWPVTENIRADYKCPIGDLACYYRPDLESFHNAWKTHGPFYSVDPAEVAAFRERLGKIAKGRPVVGLATRGGTFTTAREHRSLLPTDARKLIDSTDALFVGLDYEDLSPFAQWINQEVGPDRYAWFPAITSSWDYQHHGALAQACDMVVSVNQSIAHLSAAMGLNVRVLTPKRVAWRYGLTSEEWFWYPSPTVKLYRQSEPDSWEGPIQRAIEDIKCLSRTNTAA